MQPEEANEDARIEQITGSFAHERKLPKFVVVELNDRQADVKYRHATYVSDYALSMHRVQLMAEWVEQEDDD